MEVVEALVPAKARRLGLRAPPPRRCSAGKKGGPHSRYVLLMSPSVRHVLRRARYRFAHAKSTCVISGNSGKRYLRESLLAG